MTQCPAESAETFPDRLRAVADVPGLAWLMKVAEHVETAEQSVSELRQQLADEKAMHVSNIAYLETKCREYTDQLAEAKRDGLEQAAKICDERAETHAVWMNRADTELARNHHNAKRMEAIRTATAIRAAMQSSAKESGG